MTFLKLYVDDCVRQHGWFDIPRNCSDSLGRHLLLKYGFSHQNYLSMEYQKRDIEELDHTAQDVFNVRNISSAKASNWPNGSNFFFNLKAKSCVFVGSSGRNRFFKFCSLDYSIDGHMWATDKQLRTSHEVRYRAKGKGILPQASRLRSRSLFHE